MTASQSGFSCPVFTIQYNTTLLSLCREICFLARHLHETFNTINNKTSTTQWNTELKTSQIQEKYLTITVYTHTHARTHAPRSPHTLFFWLINRLKHSINYNETKFLKQQNTKIKTLGRPQHVHYRQHLWSNILNPHNRSAVNGLHCSWVATQHGGWEQQAALDWW